VDGNRRNSNGTPSSASAELVLAQHSEHRVALSFAASDVNPFMASIDFFRCMVAVQILCLASWRMLHFAGKRNAWCHRARRFRPFCPFQWEKFGWALNIISLPGFFLIGTIMILKYHRSPSAAWPQRLYLALSILAAAAATYSNANGPFSGRCFSCLP
jgi:hypothetical protein